jgi:Domain of unknown function (DUF3854)
MESLASARGTNSSKLLEKHRRVLEDGSAISPDVIAESGARTVSSGRELPEGFSERQRRRAPGMLFPVDRPNGERSWCFRPDRVDPERPGHKYEQPCKALGGAGNTLGILPSQRHLIGNVKVPVIFVEGTKKQLSLVSALRKARAEVLVVAIVGVWNWLHDRGKPIPDMADIPLEDRPATVMFDSDVLIKWQVQEAARRLAEHAQDRGAQVFMTYFHHKPDGAKVGADDYFAAGGTLEELRLLTRRYDPGDFRRVRLSRDETLRAMLEDLWRRYVSMPAAKVGECSDRATVRQLIRRAEQSGKPTDNGIVVRAPVRALAIKSRLGRQGQANSLKRLQANGYLERVEEPPHKVEKHGAAYLLKASSLGIGRAQSGQDRERRHQHNVSQEQGEERKPDSYADMYAGVHSARASDSEEPQVPELRHSKVVHTWARRRGGRVVVDSQYVYRLAKPRQEVLMYLLDAGGEATEAELLERFGSKSTRPRDFHRRKVEPLMGWRYSRDKRTGAERRLETGPPVVESEDGMVRILPEWRTALEEHRKQTGELEDNERQRQKLRDQSKAYRNRDRTPTGEEGPLRGKEEVAHLVEERRKEERQRWVEEQRQKVGETAATFLADELAGITAVRFADTRQRWAARGGRVEDLRRAVLYGPWRFKREEDDDLYVHHEDTRGRADGPNERIWRERQPEPEPEHPWHCDCPECGPEPRYARLRGMA